MWTRGYIRKHITLIAIIVYILMFILIIVLKPTILFTDNGNIRQFGIGYKNKTIIPVWLLSIILAILSYLIILYYLAIPRL